MSAGLCPGGGKAADGDLSIIFGLARCPDCGDLATVNDDTGKIDSHPRGDQP